MKAQAARSAIGVVSAALAIGSWLWLGSWSAWIVPLIVFVAGGAVAEWIFRRLATPDVIRDDLEDRVRNPPF
jgi:hypothetical protein